MPYVIENESESFTVTSPSAERLAEKLQPWLSPDLGRLLQAWGQEIFDPVLEVAEESGLPGTPGWVAGYGKLLDPVTCPGDWLAWLGQWVGVAVPITAPEAEARALVKAEAGLARGTLGAVDSAISRSLSGAKAFRVVERTAANGSADPYHFLILIYSSGELPSQTVLEENVNQVKPGGVFFTVVIGSLTYAVLEAAHTKYSELESAHKHYSDMEAEPAK